MPKRPRLALIAALIAGAGAFAVLSGPPAAAPPSGAVHVGSHTWNLSDPGFGGLSGLELSSDGLSFVVVSDRGSIITGKLVRDAPGAVTKVVAHSPQPLLDTLGRPVGRYENDAEGLAATADGTLFVSFEGVHRVWAYAGVGVAAEGLPVPEAFEKLQLNSGLEALAIDGDGRLIALPERSGALSRPFPVWRWEAGAWTVPYTLPRDGAFLPVGADFGPDGALYLLERDFRGIFGFRTRVSRFPMGEAGPGPREVLIETRSGRHDNLEGIAVWRDGAGDLRLTLVSDDNFSPLQRTEFVDYRLPR